MGINNGDLVYVSHLPGSMSHFDVKVGVVCECNRRGGFFIREVNKFGKTIKDSESGWYDESNVTVLCKGYLRGRLDNRNVYKEVDGLQGLIKSASPYMEKVKSEANKHSREFWARFGLE